MNRPCRQEKLATTVTATATATVVRDTSSASSSHRTMPKHSRAMNQATLKPSRPSVTTTGDSRTKAAGV